MWIGLRDIGNNGSFLWEVDKGAINFTNWKYGEPHNAGPQDCVSIGALRMLGSWDVEDCSIPLRSICEKPVNGTCKSLVNLSYSPNNERVGEITRGLGYC